MSAHNQEAWKETGTSQQWVGRKAVGLLKGPGKGWAGGERQSCSLSRSEPSPTAAFTELCSPSKLRLLHLQIVIDAYMLFFFTLHDSFSKGSSAAPGERQEAPAALVFLLCRALAVHTWGSLCHPVKRTRGIMVLACNAFHNTETDAFLYKLYPPLYLGYFSPRISCFSDQKKKRGGKKGTTKQAYFKSLPNRLCGTPATQSNYRACLTEPLNFMTDLHLWSSKTSQNAPENFAHQLKKLKMHKHVHRPASTLCREAEYCLWPSRAMLAARCLENRRTQPLGSLPLQECRHSPSCFKILFIFYNVSPLKIMVLEV